MLLQMFFSVISNFFVVEEYTLYNTDALKFFEIFCGSEYVVSPGECCIVFENVYSVVI